MRIGSARDRCDGYERDRSTLQFTSSFWQLGLSSCQRRSAIKAASVSVFQVIKFFKIVVPNFIEKVVSYKSAPPTVCVLNNNNYYYCFSCSSPWKEMGCVNCKPTKRSFPASSSRGSERPSRAQKTIEKRQRKSVRSFLRAILFVKKRKSTSKISPELCSSIQANSSSPVCP